MDLRIHAVGTAHQILAARDDGRVAMSRASTEAFLRAEAILEADAILGTICSADLHEALVPQMVQNAYAIAVIANDLQGLDLIDALPDEALFWSPVAMEVSLAGFAVLAVG